MAISPSGSPWRNTGSAKVASVMNTSHGSSSNGAQVGSANVLVIAGGDDAQAVRLDRDLRRAEHMAGGMERDFGAVEVDAFAIGDRLGRAGEILAIAQPHQVERFLRRQHRAMAGAGMVGMGMRDQRPLDRPRRIDMEGAELAAHAGRRRHQDVFGAHATQ